MSSDPVSDHGSDQEDKPTGKYLAALSLAAMGVVYGDIGTSPLYAFRESLSAHYGLATTPTNVLGVLSLIFWSLVIVISIKYLVFVLEADNNGEGGIIALTALVERKSAGRWLILAGLFGAALLYGDSMITPAISVLSAVEGLEVATPFFEPYIIPITIGILVALFAVQSYGTAGIGKVFGSVTLVWFTTLGVLGLAQIVQAPGVFRALNPVYGVDFFLQNGMPAFLALGSVFLVVTGGEALYADIGHFGLRPIRLTWYGFVLPCLLLNYFGQGALLLRNPAAAANPFFRMAPEWAIYPVVAIATAATIIASQAVISGAFSLTRQAVQLGYLPRLKVEQTSAKEIGQIYMPAINWTLAVACIGLVLGFQTSSQLAYAYGVGVTTDMVFTTILFAVVAYKVWGWSRWAVGALAGAFLVVDLAFWGANLPKIPGGGWFPLVVAALGFTIMTTWKRGRAILGERIQKGALPLDQFISGVTEHIGVEDEEIARVPGTAVYMYSSPEDTPPALLHNMKHNKVLHEHTVILNVNTVEDPYVPEGERIEVHDLGNGLFRIVVRYGFAESVNIPNALGRVDRPDLDLDLSDTTFFLGRERVLATNREEMAVWRDRLFGVMTRNQRRATDFFGLPSNRVVELGAQVEL